MKWTDGITPDDLPGSLALIAQECGVDVALALAEKMGGMHVYIHKASTVSLPLKKKFIREHRDMTVAELVLATQLSETTVREVLREGAPDERQAGLFDAGKI